MRNAVTYILPIKARGRGGFSELTVYLDRLRRRELVAEVIVVDGSAPEIFADLASHCGPLVRHLPVDEDLLGFANGKVAGVLTGVRHASHERLIVADDDVRYDAAGIAKLDQALDHADVVRPQNYFDPLPWHACVDTSRTLINRVTGGDWPGTLGVRRQALLDAGGYDGNVLFENLELVRTIRAAGGKEDRPLDLFVRRQPPQSAHFWSQRVRQAYDEFARPFRLLCWLSLVPGIGALVALYGWWVLGGAAMLAIALAECGRRVGQGTKVFPLRSSLAAPVWVLERAICAWLALAVRVTRGGVWYSGRRLSRAATPYRELVRRLSTTTSN
ncbi:MAG TPA: hypothetical protein VM096_08010 [Vicinamibacterales bacterium]|nr:hypothetical protein [Vicinamibacterales bacterium]